MGHRTLKRVPLDFQWPLHQVWDGYVNPWPGSLPCPLCDSSGYNLPTKLIADTFYDLEGFGVRWTYQYGTAPDGSSTTRPPWRVVGDCRRWCNDVTQDEVQALVDQGRLVDFTHAWTGGRWVRRADECIPTAAEVNAWNQSGFGHDAINRMILVEARAKRLGVHGECVSCKGEGSLSHPDPAIRKAYEEWTASEPPSGDGFQLWETVSEGSPISPVFATAEALADWCAENATVSGVEKTSRGAWLHMFLEDDLESGSMVVGRPGYLGAAVNMPAEP